MTTEPIPRLLVPGELPRKVLVAGDRVRFNGRMVEVDSVTCSGAGTALAVRSLSTGRLVRGPQPTDRPVKGAELRTDMDRPDVLDAISWRMHGQRNDNALTVPLTRGTPVLLDPRFHRAHYHGPRDSALREFNTWFPESGRFGGVINSRRTRDGDVTTDGWAQTAHTMRMLQAFAGGLAPAGEAILAYAAGRQQGPWSQVEQMWLAAVAAHTGIALAPEAAQFLLQVAPQWDGTLDELVNTARGAFAVAA